MTEQEEGGEKRMGQGGARETKLVKHELPDNHSNSPTLHPQWRQCGI